MTTNPIKTYLYKLFIMLPFTFLFAPVFYLLFAFFGIGNSNPAFPFLVYIWYALFIYFGMTLALILKKYKYLVYPIIIAVAYFARNVASLPVFDFQKIHVPVDDLGEPYLDEFGNIDYISVPIDAGELAYVMLMLFLTTVLVGCFSAAYAKKTALEFMKRGNTFLFFNLAVIGGLLHGNPIYLGLFAASYFIARNFILINRELEVYSEKGAYNVSGARRIVAYYFSMTVIFSVAPLIISSIIVPVIITGIAFLAGAVFTFIINKILEYEREMPHVNEVELPGGTGELMPERLNEQLDEMFVYNIILIIFLITLFIFRKPIWRILKKLAALLKAKMNLPEYDKNKVINEEIITELPKEKIKKGRAAYKNYLKISRGIADVSQRFLFAYNCLHWELVKKDAELKESLTPHELSEIIISGAAQEKYKDLSGVKNLYEDIKYGRITQHDDLLKDMTAKTEILLKQALS